MVRSKRFFMKFYLVLIIAFLYIPIAVLVVLSFNNSRSRVVWGGFTLEWYKTLFHNSDVVAALQNTLTIGFGSALIATVIGVLPPLPVYPDDNDIWMPAGACPFRSAPAMMAQRDGRMLSAYAVLKPGVSFSTLLIVAAFAGVGGGNFASSMTNINAFYPDRLKGWALGLNAGGGNLGVAAVRVGLALYGVDVGDRREVQVFAPDEGGDLRQHGLARLDVEIDAEKPRRHF